MKRSGLLYALIPILAAGIFSVFHLLPFLETAENRVYDLLLQVKPAIPEHDSILLLEVDDTAIEEIGVWPWSRDVVANGLIALREFQSGPVVLDIEYVNQSPLAVNGEVLNEEIPQAFQSQFSSLRSNIVNFFNALESGQIPLSQAEDFIQELAGLTEQTRQDLLERVQDISRDNDVYFGRTARLHGQTYGTVNILDEPDPTTQQQAVDNAVENFPIENIENEIEGPFYYRASAVRPVIYEIGRGLAGAGFPNVVVDPDGVRRRIQLVARYNDTYFPQLAFSAVYDMMGRPNIVAQENFVRLEGAMLPDAEEPRDIRIPLAEGGRFLINWPKGQYEETFRRMSFWQLELMQRAEERLMTNLRNLKSLNTFRNYPDFTNDPIQQYERAEQIKEEILNGGDPARMAEYRRIRQQLFDEVGGFLASDTEEFMVEQYRSALDAGQVPEGQVQQVEQALQAIQANFAASRDLYDSVATARERIREHVPDSLVFIGYTGTGTTDIGVNPFDSEYKNVGTHASVANTIFQTSFIDHLPLWYSIIAAFVFAIATAFIIRNLDPVPSLVVGLSITVVVFAAGGAFFILTQSYFPVLTPVLSTFFTFLTIVGIKFVQTAQERSFIRSAFSHYLSSDVISQIISDPSKLRLGGEKKYLTAFFTDIKGFSSISEALDPTDLVKLLNNYLTEMSDIILDLRGTIDKFEGDAIISFFGAPIEFEDHAGRACRAAVRMKKAERVINDQIMQEQLSPSPLYTRIGINTGNMVVGNMGTAQKMDYTMMGNSVNLAARLEGVNKQYGTWTLVSETTRNDAGDEFAFRELDRVRVVGIDQPVRLYELVDEKAMLDAETKQLLEAFSEAMEYFENRDWQQALNHFQEVLKIRPEDGPTQFYVKRSKEFIRKPPPENWDGAFNLTMK